MKSITMGLVISTFSVALLTSAGKNVVGMPLYTFQTKSGAQIYTTVYMNKGIKTRSDQLYYRANSNSKGNVLFNASDYGKGSVLLNAVMGRPNTVYVLANISGSRGTESTVFSISTDTKKILGKVRLFNLGIDNVLPNPFIYEPSTNTVKVNASRGYSNKNGTVSSRSGFFWIGLIETNAAIIKKSQFD
ncbi:hypothetical protein K7W42_22625 [Deinococcus sp. HMF7604]|uniref:hypothetical protein n=1 Tax=Deinococcus betulae TaxID=2873312 RepID=UPI001CD0161B|nr:hypothetical protein [Deinococcus betulae]MBZ9753622.1 hypothetical protein [Deinococcus betulae]